MGRPSTVSRRASASLCRGCLLALTLALPLPLIFSFSCWARAGIAADGQLFAGPAAPAKPAQQLLLLSQNPGQPLSTDASAAATDQKLPLRGLTGGTSLGVYPTLDKSLLITPGAHPAKVTVPLSEIVAGGKQITGKIEHQDKTRGKYQGMLISVVNNADRPLLFDGDAAVASSAEGPLACVPLTKLEKLSVLPEQSTNFGTKLKTDLEATTTAAVTMGWYQTLRDAKRFHGPVITDDGGRYGLDEQRRQDQLRRFGKRVLWPGDTSSGVIYFDTSKSLSGLTIDLPVSSYYDPKDKSDMVLGTQ